ncbi:hypothetical protein [Carnobacterium maltaromaticum]|uniref:hypothetical protein n=1 Tax=Carnobacterium maltaromaticum TaxID=2751 RepID=UPI00165C9D17|nr:hypothetical protein [Carnobacterium maltaromaticum]MBC9808725.1 hypothetical protein [Carnobacterium maltaromaticum]
MNLETIFNIIDYLVGVFIFSLTCSAIWQGYTLKIGNWFKSSQLPLKDYFKKGANKNDK